MATSFAAAAVCVSTCNFANAQFGDAPRAQGVEDELFPPLEPAVAADSEITVLEAPADKMEKMESAKMEEMTPEAMAPKAMAPKTMTQEQTDLPFGNEERLASLNTLYLNQWVQLDAANSLRGRVVVINDMQVESVSGIEVMISRNSQIVATAVTNATGEFTFGDMQSGYYAITTEAPNALACLGLTVLANNDARHLPNSVEVRAIGGTSQRFEELVSMFPAVTTPDLDDMVEIAADPIGGDRRFANTHMVSLREDGSLTGRVGRSARLYNQDDLSDISVYVLKDGSQVGGVQVDRDGAFRIPNMTEGCYSFVAVGPRDIGVCAFCAVSQNLAMHLPRKGRFVAMQQTAVPQLNVEVVDRATLPTIIPQEGEIIEELVLDAPAGNFAPVGGGGFGGGGGQILGGGGGGGGFGNFRGFGNIALGAAGLAGVIAAIADDDDDVVFTPPPVVSAIAP